MQTCSDLYSFRSYFLQDLSDAYKSMLTMAVLSMDSWENAPKISTDYVLIEGRAKKWNEKYAIIIILFLNRDQYIC